MIWIMWDHAAWDCGGLRYACGEPAFLSMKGVANCRCGERKVRPSPHTSPLLCLTTRIGHAAIRRRYGGPGRGTCLNPVCVGRGGLG